MRQKIKKEARFKKTGLKMISFLEENTNVVKERFLKFQAVHSSHEGAKGRMAVRRI